MKQDILLHQSDDGANDYDLAVQVGGNHKALLAHIQDVMLCPAFGSDIDFKLARSTGPDSAKATAESHFDSLQVSICKVGIL